MASEKELFPLNGRPCRRSRGNDFLSRRRDVAASTRLTARSTDCGPDGGGDRGIIGDEVAVALCDDQ